MATHTIQIWNQSGNTTSYAAFIVSHDEISQNPLSNAWLVFPHVLSGGFDSVTYDDSLYAYWGTTPSGLVPGTVVQSGGAVPVDPANADMAMFDAGGPGFSQVVPGRSQPGTVGITSNAFMPQEGYVFGLAKVGKTPIPTPIFTLPGQPNMTYIFTPGNKVQIMDGAFAPGEAADLSETAGGVVIDFSGRPQTTATAIQAANGTWTVTYS